MPHRRWTQLVAGGAVLATGAVLVLTAIPVVFGSPQPMVRVSWRDISETDRVAIERSLRLSESTPIGNGIRSYVPLDTSPDVMRAIVTHPAVVDTDGINRRTQRLADRPPLTPRRGGLFGGAPSWMAGAGRALAYALAGCSALLFLLGLVTSPWCGPDSGLRRLIRRSRGQAIGLLVSSLVGVRTGWQRPGLAEAIVALSVFVVTLAWRFLTFTGFTNDHYAHLALAQQMLLGDRPIRDFSDPGWPLTYLLTATGWGLAGHSMATEWCITATGFAVGAASTFVVASRLSGSVAIALLVTAFEVLIFPRTYSYPKMLVYGAGTWVMCGMAARPSGRQLGQMAAAITIAFLFRHDHGLFLGVASVVALVVCSRAARWHVAAQRVAVLTAATFVLLLPWILFVALNGGVLSYLEGGLEYSRGEAAATALTEVPRLSLGAWTTGTTNAEAWLFWLFWSLPVASAVIIWRRLQRHEERRPGELAIVGAVAVTAVLVNGSFIRQAVAVRLPDAVVPAAILGAWLLGTCWVGAWPRRTVQWAVRVLTVVCIVLSGLAVSRIGRVPDQIDEASIGRGVASVVERAGEVSAMLSRSHRGDTPSRYSTALQPFFAYLDRCSSQSDRLIVTGEFPDVVVLAGRRFAGDGVVFGAWYSSFVHQDRTLARLKADPALFVLHMGDYQTFRTRFRVIDTYLNEAYGPVASISVTEGGVIQILASRERRSVGIDQQTGYPCFSNGR